jgi:hypothetical protein
MLATLGIEFAGAVYTAWRYKLNVAGRLITLLLICLGTFQLAEFFICTRADLPGVTLAKLGHVAITLLPALGIHLGMALAGKKSATALGLLYFMPVAFIVYFAGTAEAITGQQCLGNYVIFTTQATMTPVYGLYYYGFLLLGTTLIWRWAKQARKKSVSQALHWLALGCISFLLPTTTINLLLPETVAGIPSIMCGFAVLFALILLFKVGPATGSRRQLVLPLLETASFKE